MEGTWVDKRHTDQWKVLKKLCIAWTDGMKCQRRVSSGTSQRRLIKIDECVREEDQIKIERMKKSCATKRESLKFATLCLRH